MDEEYYHEPHTPIPALLCLPEIPSCFDTLALIAMDQGVVEAI